MVLGRELGQTPVVQNEDSAYKNGAAEDTAAGLVITR